MILLNFVKILQYHGLLLISYFHPKQYALQPKIEYQNDKHKQYRYIQYVRHGLYKPLKKNIIIFS